MDAVEHVGEVGLRIEPVHLGLFDDRHGTGKRLGSGICAGHEEGGKAWGRIASLTETAKINGVEPFAYLKATLEAIAAGPPQARIDERLPWNFKPSS